MIANVTITQDEIRDAVIAYIKTLGFNVTADQLDFRVGVETPPPNSPPSVLIVGRPVVLEAKFEERWEASDGPYR